MSQDLLLGQENSDTVRGPIDRGYEKETTTSEIMGVMPSPRRSEGTTGSNVHPSFGASSTSLIAEGLAKPAPLIRRKNTSTIIPRRIRILQQWEGVVTEVHNREFSADVRSLTESDAPVASGEFSFDEISDSDHCLVCAGAVFYWVIGYDTSEGGQIKRISEIRFRRSPEWTSRKLEAVTAEAEEWFRQIT